MLWPGGWNDIKSVPILERTVMMGVLILIAVLFLISKNITPLLSPTANIVLAWFKAGCNAFLLPSNPALIGRSYSKSLVTL